MCITYLHVDLVNCCRNLDGSIQVCIVCLSDQFLPEIGSRVYDIVDNSTCESEVPMHYYTFTRQCHASLNVKFAICFMSLVYTFGCYESTVYCMIVLYHFVLFVCFSVLLDYDTTQLGFQTWEGRVHFHSPACLVGKLVLTFTFLTTRIMNPYYS